MRKPAIVTLLLLLTVPVLSLSAQADLPLTGPLVATTAAQQDAIFLYDLASDSTRELAFGAGEHHLWDFSPDGCRILFTVDSGTDNLPLMFSARLDGSDVREMVWYEEGNEPAGVLDWGIWEPDWSPTGRIAFTLLSDIPQTDGSIERAKHVGWIDGEGGEPTLYSVTGRENTPTWSPDGQWLAYVSYDERVPGVDVFSTAVPTVEPPPGTPTEELPTILEADLWMVSVDGGTKYPLTDFPTGSVRSPRWSPDGELIGFVYAPSGNNDTFWMTANQRGAILTQLSFRWNLTLDYTWLPDSSAMIASVGDFQGVETNRVWHIPLIGDADSGGELFLPDDLFTYTDFPRFSADGRYLALRNEYSLVLIDLTDNTHRRLFIDRPGNTPPVWSPATFSGEANCG